MFDRGSALESISTGRREQEHALKDDGRGMGWGGRGSKSECEKEEKVGKKEEKRRKETRLGGSHHS